MSRFSCRPPSLLSVQKTCCAPVEEVDAMFLPQLGHSVIS